jgi:uncharacterized protein YdaU (DUF1376 family)
MPIFIGDYLADTGHLTTEAHGAYFLLLLHQWRVGHFKDEAIPAITRSASSTSQAAVKQMLSKDEAGLWYSPRLDREKTRWAEKKATYAERASKGGKAKAQKAASSSASSTPQAVLESCTSPSPSPNKKQSATPQAALELPDWVSKDAWSGFVEMRNKKRAPNTERALRQILRVLEKLKASGNDPDAVLDQSTMRGWTGVFELKGAIVPMPVPKPKSQYERDWDAQIEERRKILAGEIA